MEAADAGCPLAVLLFDINFLKKTNDTEGHLAGDRLIRTAADCISSCFGQNSFRFGGDEFAAVVMNCTPDTVEKMIDDFREAQKKKNVSVSVGYAYTRDSGKTTFRELMDEADRNMYKEKQMIHNMVLLAGK